MGARNPQLLQRGVSPSCRCASQSKLTRGVCYPCYQYHTSRLNADAYKRKLAKWRQRYYEQREFHVERARKWNMKNSDRVYYNRIRATYNMSPTLHRELLEMQGGRCAICRVRQEDLGARLEVDHCHETGENRGLLCGPCNRGLGAHQKAGTGKYSWYLQWTPVMRLNKLRQMSDEERALWNW